VGNTFMFGEYEILGRYATLFHFLQNGPKHLTTRGLMAIYLSNKYRSRSRAYNVRYFRPIIDCCIDFLRTKGYLKEKRAIFVGKYLCPLFNKAQQALLMNLAKAVADSNLVNPSKAHFASTVTKVLEEHLTKIQERIKGKAKRD